MRISTSSFVLASLAFSGSALAAPTPTMPNESPIPNSPKLDDWTDAVRSPRVARSPLMPAVRTAGRRRSLPRFKRQDDSSTAPANGLLGNLGDAAGGLLHQIGDVANGLPLVPGLGILSDSHSKRQEDAQTASANGLLGNLGDAVDGALHQIGDVVNGLPVIPSLGILSDGHSKRQEDASNASTDGLLGNLGDTVNGVLHQIENTVHGLPIIPSLGILSDDGNSHPQKRDASVPLSSSLSQDQLDALRQQVAGLLQQQQAVDQVTATLSAVNNGLPVDADALRQRLGGLLGSGGLNLHGLLEGLPVAGPLLSNTAGGLLSSVGGIAGGLPVVGGLLGANGPLGQLGLNNILTQVNDVTGGVSHATSGLMDVAPDTLKGLLGGNAGTLQNVLGAAKPAHSPTIQSSWPDISGFYPHSLVNGAPAVPPNTPAPTSLPSVPPPSPASSSASVPMAHGGSASMSMSIPTATLADMPDVPTPSTVLDGFLSRRMGNEPVGEMASDMQPDDDADGFIPSIPDDSYHSPLLGGIKRADAHGVDEGDMHEGGVDAVPGSQDQLTGIKTAPQQKMVRRLRGITVSF